MEAGPSEDTPILMTLEGGELAQVGSARKAFAIPEVLSAILSHCTQGECAVGTRVSRTWNPVALDWVWKDLVSLKPLLELLDDVVKDDAGHLIFKQGIAPQDWDHFFSVARRVRSLIHDDLLHGIISASLLGSLLSGVASAVRGHILPNVRRITWNAHDDTMANHLIPFLSPTLTKISISLNDIESGPALNLLNSLAYSLPSKLEAFDFQSFDGSDSSQCQRALEALVGRLPRLQRLRVPEGLFGRSIQSFKHVAAGYHLLDLRFFYLPTVEESTKQLFTTLVDLFPRLETLKLDVAHMDRQPQPSLTFDMLQPLLGLDLVELQITHPDPIILTPENIEAMGGTPIGHLRHFALSFTPKLKRLAHYFSTSLPIPAGNAVSRSFPNLEVLGVGTTVFEEKIEWLLGTFFAALCPKGVKMAYGAPESEWGGPAFETMDTEEWHVDWDFILQAMEIAHLSQEGAVQRYLNSQKSIGGLT